MSRIAHIEAREILDSRGNPTVEVDVITTSGFLGRAMISSGASTGSFEAYELRDQDPHRFNGKGVLQAVANIKQKVAPYLIEKDVFNQMEIDKLLIELDQTENKKKIGANAILGVSLACARAASEELGIPLYKYLGGMTAIQLPVPLMNLINGGAHANNGLSVQEFMIVPWGFNSYLEALRAGVEIFHNLKKNLMEKGFSVSVGDEGGFAPALKTNEEALALLCQAIEKANYRLGEQVGLALDIASNEFFKNGIYELENKKLTADELGKIYESWLRKYPILSIEDGWAEEDWQGWLWGTQNLKIQLVGDDLFVTNPKRIAKGIQMKVANALLVKVNQIGTLSETIQAVKMAKNSGYRTIMSHRSGETEDVFISHLAVGLGCEQIKTGGLSRSDRMAKYNELIRISQDIKAENMYFGGGYWGKAGFN